MLSETLLAGRSRRDNIKKFKRKRYKTTLFFIQIKSEINMLFFVFKKSQILFIIEKQKCFGG